MRLARGRECALRLATGVCFVLSAHWQVNSRQLPKPNTGSVCYACTASNPQSDSSLIPGRFFKECGSLIAAQPDRGWAELAAAPFSHYLVEGAKHDPTA